MTKIKKFFIKNYKLIISYGFIFFGIITAITIIIVKPQKSETLFLYDSSSTSQTMPVSFPFEIQIKNKANNLNYVDFYLGNDSLNEYQYTLKLYDEAKIYFEHEYVNYNSNIIRIPITEGIELDKVLTLNIDCKQCKDVKFDLYKSVDTSHIIGDEENTLQIVEVGRSVNYGYIWYALLFVAIGLTLLPLAKESCNEKQNH